MNRQDHFVCLRGIVQRFVLIPQPQQLALAVVLADIHTEFDERGVHRIPERIGMLAVAGAFDGDCPLVVLPAGRTPGTVLFFDTKRHTTVIANSVVTAGLTVRADEASTDALGGKLVLCQEKVQIKHELFK